MSRSSALAAAAAFVVGLGLPPADALDEAIGRAMFRRAWVPAPSATRSDDGLGPLFDARSCAACHPGGDRPVVSLDHEGAATARGLVVRLAGADGAPDPVYGRQMQREAVTGVPVEATITVARTRQRVGGRALTRPLPRLADLGYGGLAPATRVSLRLAPPLFGLAAIEDVPEEAIRAVAAKQAAAGGEVRGRVSEILDDAGTPRVGRFGFKAQQIDLGRQTAEAFSTDMGLSSPWKPAAEGDCRTAQGACLAAPQGAPDRAGPHEIDAAIVAAIVDHLRALPVPTSPTRGATKHGEELFAAVGCAACHGSELGGRPALRTDLLLHDLGEGLSSGSGEGSAGPRDWRTAPLAGLGHAAARGAGLLHDGRARTLEAAILWHDGEAAGARRRFAALPNADRRALLAFLASL